MNGYTLVNAPDGSIVNCKRCGRGVLKIKCPYCHRGESIISVAASDKNFCLKSSSVDGSLSLDIYYYQVQTQLFVLMWNTVTFV